MKKLLFVLVLSIVMLSCSTTKEASTSRTELRKEKKLTDQFVVKSAVDSRKFIIKLNRIYFSGGGMVELVPRANYIIIDGDRAVINTAYLGRQWDVRGIAAIDVRGRAQKYDVLTKLSKGSYEINLKVGNGNSYSFDVYLTISKSGYCNASISSIKIDNVRYSGYLVPIPEDPNGAFEEGRTI